MIRLFRKLKISLATKCQLLFGASVVLVIGAALFVPWQRMEQLSEQPNESAARLLAQAAIRDHIDRFSAESPRPRATTRRASATTQAATPAAATAPAPRTTHAFIAAQPTQARRQSRSRMREEGC